MPGWRALLLLACLRLGAAVDLDSGPARSTIQSYGWGTLFYEPMAGGTCRLERVAAGFRFTSDQGQVLITGSEFGGLQLAWEKEVLTITHLNGTRGIEVRCGRRAWHLSLWLGRLTLTATDPKDTVTFDRNGNRFTIRGARGTVAATAAPESLTVQSPLGTTTILNQGGRRTFAGPPLDQIPYLGRGLFIPFHGVGVFVDITRHFPMAEVVEWLEWRPLNLEP